MQLNPDTQFTNGRTKGHKRRNIVAELADLRSYAGGGTHNTQNTAKTIRHAGGAQEREEEKNNTQHEYRGHRAHRSSSVVSVQPDHPRRSSNYKKIHLHSVEMGTTSWVHHIRVKLHTNTCILLVGTCVILYRTRR